MRGTVFYKMSGSGNDFVMLDGRGTTTEDWPSALIQAICDRRRGVGADGLVLLTPSTPDSVRMTYWNSDGSRTALCGNAALCSGRLAVYLELVSPGEFCLLTDAGPVRTRSIPSTENAEINLPDAQFGEFSHISLGSGEEWMALLTVGVPHLVVRVGNVEAVDVAARGRALRFEPNLGPAGANVNFVSPGPSGQRPWLIRTYERGVEGETLACGTGTAAAAIAVVNRGEAAFPLVFQSRGGPELAVRAELISGRASDVWLSGEGQLVFRGVWERP